MALVTVVVPIYNVEKYLRTCFDSLLQQSYKDFVVMAISDGSPDNSEVIIDEYVSKYPDKFIGIKKENGGYGSVLEYAIEHMNTPYFLVCDPDDYLHKEALDKLVKLALMSDADVTIGAKYFIYNESDKQDYDPAYNTQFAKLKTNYVYKKDKDEFKNLFFVDPSPHAKLYKKALSKQIVFPHKVGYTDNLLFYRNLLSAEKVIYTDFGCAYYLVDRPGNTMTDVRPKAIHAHVLVFKTVLDQCSSGPDIFYYRMFEGFKFILRQCEHIDGSKEEINACLDDLYGLVEKLLPHSKQILKEYDNYSSARIIEKGKDKGLLVKATSKLVYNSLKKRILEKEG